MKALVDSGSELNFVAQLLVKEAGWVEPEEVVQAVRMLDRRTMPVYGIHNVSSRIADSNGQAKQYGNQCYAIDIQGYDLILGYPWLQQYNPNLDWANGTWSYTEPSTLPEVATEDQFSTSAQQAGCIYTIRYADIEPAEARKPEVQLPSEYAEYTDMFSEANVNMLLAGRLYNHTIDLKGR